MCGPHAPGREIINLCARAHSGRTEEERKNAHVLAPLAARRQVGIGGSNVKHVRSLGTEVYKEHVFLDDAVRYARERAEGAVGRKYEREREGSV